LLSCSLQLLPGLLPGRRILPPALAARGTNVQLLTDEGRFEMACQMLMDTDVEIQRVAVTLEYADAGAFTRAFRRWSGSRHRGGGPAGGVRKGG
jgi:hypothetical protein